MSRIISKLKSINVNYCLCILTNTIFYVKINFVNKGNLGVAAFGGNPNYALADEVAIT